MVVSKRANVLLQQLLKSATSPFYPNCSKLLKEWLICFSNIKTQSFSIKSILTENECVIAFFKSLWYMSYCSNCWKVLPARSTQMCGPKFLLQPSPSTSKLGSEGWPLSTSARLDHSSGHEAEVLLPGQELGFRLQDGPERSLVLLHEEREQHYHDLQQEGVITILSFVLS